MNYAELLNHIYSQLGHMEEFNRINKKLENKIAELEEERAVRDLEQKTKGVREALTEVKRIGGGFPHECLFEYRIHDLQAQGKALKEKGE